MRGCRIILLLLTVAGCRPWTPQNVPPGAAPVVVQEFPAAGPPLAVSPEAAVYPPHSTVVPLPSHTPGSIFGPPVAAPMEGPLADIAPGGSVSPQFGLPPGPDAIPPLASSISVPVTNDEWAWDQITDVVSDYFTITAEQRARRGGEAMIEGRIDTAPQDGATWLEPQRDDSVGRFNRWESTFQTIRRRAAIRVVPDGVGYTIEIAVEKELEDLPHPERATAGAATFRNDGSLADDLAEQVSRTRTSPRWISLGRDPPLEQRMLAEIHSRLIGAATAANQVFPR
jgi:hypothetical protein